MTDGARKFLLAEQGFDVAPGLQDVHNTNPGVRDSIENDGVSHGKAAITVPQIVPATARPGIVTQQFKVVDQEVDESVCRPLAVFSNVLPNLEHISPSAPRQPIACH